MAIDTLYELVRHSVRMFPNKVAYEMCDGEKVTYAEVGARIAKVQEMLVSAGLEPGDKVALLSSNMPYRFCPIFRTTSWTGSSPIPNARRCWCRTASSPNFRNGRSSRSMS